MLDTTHPSAISPAMNLYLAVLVQLVVVPYALATTHPSAISSAMTLYSSGLAQLVVVSYVLTAARWIDADWLFANLCFGGDQLVEDERVGE